MTSWDDYETWIIDALRDAYSLSTDSPDPSTQVGAIVYNEDLERVSWGCNEFTRGVTVTPELLERPTKIVWIEHAERNALFDALCRHQDVRAGTMVCPWAACVECAKAIVQGGIDTLVRHKQAADRTPERWSESLNVATEILTLGGVEIIDYDGPVGAVPVLQDGKLWTP